LAPEVLRKQEYDRAVDWWCLGVVLYEMLYGLPPFYSRDTAEMYDNILFKPLRLKSNISPDARSILEGLLQKDKTKRLGSGPGDVVCIQVQKGIIVCRYDLIELFYIHTHIHTHTHAHCH
jgi:serine/threonine protein kinase